MLRFTSFFFKLKNINFQLELEKKLQYSTKTVFEIYIKLQQLHEILKWISTYYHKYNISTLIPFNLNFVLKKYPPVCSLILTHGKEQPRPGSIFPNWERITNIFLATNKFFSYLSMLVREKKISRGKNYLCNPLLAQINGSKVVKNSLFEREKKYSIK